MKLSLMLIYLTVYVVETSWRRRYTYNLINYSTVKLLTTTSNKQTQTNCLPYRFFEKCTKYIDVNELMDENLRRKRHGELLKVEFDEYSKAVDVEVKFNRPWKLKCIIMLVAPSKKKAIDFVSSAALNYVVKNLLLTFKEAFNISAISIEIHADGRVVRSLNYASSKLLCEFFFPTDAERCNFKTALANGIILHVLDSFVADKVVVKFFPPIVYNYDHDIKHFYSISQFFVGGRCACSSGQTSPCVVAKQDNVYTNDGTRAILLCSTDRSYLSYGYYIYKRRRRRRDVLEKSCLCYRGGTLHGLCKPFVSLDYQCPCKSNFAGSFCDKCLEGFHTFPKCTSCDCNFIGAVSSYCNVTTGQCDCEKKYTGLKCDQCAPGRYNFPFCYECPCPKYRTDSSVCNPVTGKCNCLKRYSGEKCSSCKTWLEDFPVCHRPGCKCSVEGSIDGTCDDNRVCYCKKNYAGKECHYCAVGYGSYPNCTACECSPIGSYDNNCDVRSGQCFCRPHFTGKSCNKCTNETLIFPNCNNAGQCICNKAGTRYDTERPGACVLGESCFCKRNVHGSDCSECKPKHYNLNRTNTQGCDKCQCSRSGVFANLGSCDQQSGQCICKPNVDGRTCDSCNVGHYKMDRWSIFGCSACNCNIGGSTSLNCGRSGICQCKDNFEGQFCNKLKDGPYYVPDFYHNKVEVESATSDDKPVIYRYSKSEFANFTGRGYIVFGAEQSDVKLTIEVPKTRKYKILVRNVLKEAQKATLLVYLRVSKTKEISYAGVIDFNIGENNYNTDTTLQPRYELLQTSEGKNEFILTKGTWEMDLSSISPYLLVDHVVIIPEEYYTASKLQPESAKECLAGTPKTTVCKMYKYISLKKFQMVQAESGTNSRGFGQQLVKKTELFKDPDLLSQLPVLNDMAELSRNQIALTLEVTVESTNQYHVILTYFNPDDVTYRLDVYDSLTGKRGYIEALPCLYSFLCRVVVLHHNGVPLLLRYSVNSTVSLTFVGNIRGSLAIDYITLIPVSEWSPDYVLPHELCYMKDKKCLRNVKFNTPEDAIPVEPTKNNPANPLTNSVYAVSELRKRLMLDNEYVTFSRKKGTSQDVDVKNQKTVFFEASLPKQAKYVVVYHYYQPNFPSFTVNIQILQGALNKSSGVLTVKHCSANFGCRGVFTNGVLEGDVIVTFEIPKGKELWVDSVSLVPEESYHEDILLPRRQELTTKFTRSCVDSNKLPLNKPPDGFCMQALITLTSEFTNQTYRCHCNQRGSYSLECDKIGGQCRCKPGVVGKNCDKCQTGYYGFPYCKACNCFIGGSTSADCNQYGECKCKEKYTGKRCDRCVRGHWGFPDCRDCACDRRGSFSLTCRGHDGQCSCLRNYGGRQCNKCQVGHFGFPYCRSCNCNSAGIVITPDSPTGCYKQDPNRCDCKQNVNGASCGVCKEHYYGLSIRNPDGCKACNCSKFGTIPGSGACNPITGQCQCQPNIVGLSCDSCKDGYYVVQTDRVFTCQPCLCSVGGSLHSVCDKHTGQCKCKARVAGLKCNRMASGDYYLPSIGQFSFTAQDIVPSANIENIDIFEGAKVNSSFASRQMTLNVPSSGNSDVDGFGVIGNAEFNAGDAGFNTFPNGGVLPEIEFKRSYHVLLYYSLTTVKPAKIHLIFNKEGSQSPWKERKQIKHKLRSKKLMKPTVDIIKKNHTYFTLKLSEGLWKLQLIFKHDIIFSQITIVPVEHFENGKVSKSITNPCTIKDSKRFCSLYTYYDLTRAKAITLEAERYAGDNATYFDSITYKGANINGAVKIEKDFYFSTTVNSLEDYYIIIQYINTNQESVMLSVNVRYEYTLERGQIELFPCSYAFGCRQVVVLNTGHKSLYKGGEGKRWFEMKIVAGQHAFIEKGTSQDVDVKNQDFISLVPSSSWSSNLITPAFYCMRRSARCIEGSFPKTPEMFSLEAEAASGVSLFNNSPPDGQPSTVAVLLSRYQRNLRWISPLRLGGYYIIVHYYQPVIDTFYAKIILATYQRANAGKVSFKYCPSIYGCRSVITYLDEDLPQRFFLTGNILRATITMLQHHQVWVDRIEFISPGDYDTNPNILEISPVDLSKRYLRKCVGRKDKYIERSNKDFCRSSLFELTLGLNKYPLACKCDPQGTLLSVRCSPYDGQCACKAGFTSRDCSECVTGIFPYCKPREKLYG